MVVQWEDRFHQGNRAHTYLGPIDHPEAVGKGDGLGPEPALSRLRRDRQGLRLRRRATSSEKADLSRALEEMIAYDGPYVLDVASRPTRSTCCR